MADGERLLLLSVLIALLVWLLWRQFLSLLVILTIAVFCAGVLTLVGGLHALG